MNIETVVELCKSGKLVVFSIACDKDYDALLRIIVNINTEYPLKSGYNFELSNEELVKRWENNRKFIVNNLIAGQNGVAINYNLNFIGFGKIDFYKQSAQHFIIIPPQSVSGHTIRSIVKLIRNEIGL